MSLLQSLLFLYKDSRINNVCFKDENKHANQFRHHVSPVLPPITASNYRIDSD